MTDFQTRTRIHGSGYSFSTIRDSCHSFHELYKERTQIHFRRPFPHDCRLETTRRYTDSTVFEAKVFSEGVRLTAKSCGELARKEERQTGVSKLIYAVGGRPSASEGKFKFPKGLAVAPNSDIYVADSGNNRIQVLNQCGVFKYSFNDGLNQPSSVAVLPNSNAIVADRRNKRLRLFDEYGDRKHDINLSYQPAELVLLDISNDLAVSNQNGLVEIFDTETFDMKYSFKPNSTKIFQMATNNQGNLLIANSNGKVLTYSISNKGQLLSKFIVDACKDGLFCDPGGIYVNPFNQIIVGDSLNHTVNLYSEFGLYIKAHITPSDDCGAVRNLVIGKEGHLVTSEFSGNSKHYVKLFRYRKCSCHYGRPNSSRSEQD